MRRRWQLVMIVFAALCMTGLGIFIALANNIEEPPRRGELIAIGTVAICDLLWLIPWIFIQLRRRDRRMVMSGVILFAVAWSPFLIRSFHHPRFDAAKWKRSINPTAYYDEHPAYGAGYMVTDIIESGVCIGKTMPQIEELLGEGHFNMHGPQEDPELNFQAYYYTNKALFDGCDKLELRFEHGVCTSAGFAGCD